MKQTANRLPSQRVLMRLLSLDQRTGLLRWRPRPAWMFGGSQSVANSWNGKFAEQPAFTAQDESGYFRGCVLGIQTSAHRVIWKIATGADPEFIDHINGDPTDNRPVNLRDVSHRQNCKNTKIRSDNSSGHHGVSWDKRKQKWRSYITGDSGQFSLGYYSTKAEAVAARRGAEKCLGFGPTHGRDS